MGEVVEVEREGLAVFVEGDDGLSGGESRIAGFLLFLAESFLLRLLGLPLLAGAFFGALIKCSS